LTSSFEKFGHHENTRISECLYHLLDWGLPIRRFIAGFALALCILGISPSVAASLIFETATGSPLSSGLSVDDFFWPTHRFEITSATGLSSVGGFFDNTTAGAITIFGAVIALSGPADFPDSLDLSTSDVLGAALLDIDAAPGDYSGKLSLALDPGWYALAFGTGRFGADSTVGSVFMPSLALDLNPALPFTAIQAGNPFGTPPQFIFQNATPRFFAAAPEPATPALVAIGLAGLLTLRAGLRYGRGALPKSTEEVGTAIRRDAGRPC